ncbi:hypothetical protein FJM67_13220 [Maribrevibacterium harenarium]|uniref:CorA-like Mg2+ transporter protein n=1 Tax=Maribrevibacterium harenarium TaxID=2589817 RepID=A0A501WG98_9GAMM|nr:hypothetical protein [Maribrevibacterium harenarium]TPE48589.1 hypothetical protein FJM67_13220 [Maribrevibacterium harenarium]
MKKYHWQGWGLLPLFISKTVFNKIVAAPGWFHWSEGLGQDQIKDLRRFYTRAAADLMRPMSSGRFVFTSMDGDTPLLTMVPTYSEQIGSASINVTKLQLIALGEVSLLYIHFESSSQFDMHAVSELNRVVFQWEPRTQAHQITRWRNQDGHVRPLKQQISDLIGIVLEQDSHYEEDAFGHELVNCSWIRQMDNSGLGENLCVSDLSAGINLSDPRYQLSDQEKKRLLDNQFSYWADWRCQFNLNRLVFVDQTEGDSALAFNLSGNNYYLDLLAAVIGQRATLNRFKDEMVLCSNKQRGNLYERIAIFRKQYKISNISTYPFAERLYQYLCYQTDLELVEEKTFVELEHNYALWKQEKEDSSNAVMLLVSLVAALLVPASSIATIMALSKSQMNLLYWSLSGGITLVTVLVMIWPPLKRYWKGRKS